METTSDFTVRFSKRIARVLEYQDATGIIEFTLDTGNRGDKSICLEHHPSSWPRRPNYELAFQRSKEFLEACGYLVEIYGR